jgi:hypothetical protein
LATATAWFEPPAAGEEMMGAVHLEQLTPLDGGVLRHDADEPVAALLGHHRQRDAGVAAGRLQDRGAGLQQALLLRGLDHGDRRAVLDRSRRVVVLELGPQADVGGRRQRRQPDERGAAE